MSSTGIYQAIYDANLHKGLREILLTLLRYNNSPSVEEPIRQFLNNYQIMSENFWAVYNKASNYEDILDAYYQFSKNQCTAIETLLLTLNETLDKDDLRKEMSVMMRECFTF